jgi:hypothetical protein
MANLAGNDSPLSVTGSIVGIVALMISISTIIQALCTYFLAYRDAPAELNRFTSSTSNTVDENSHRLRAAHIPGPVHVELEKGAHTAGRWTDMLQEYYDAHLELSDELCRIKLQSERTNSVFNLNRLLWVFKRKDLEETVKRVETLRMRKMAVALSALTDDVNQIKDMLERIESRIPEGPLRLPPAKAPVEYDIASDMASLGLPLNLYPDSVLSEDPPDSFRTSLESR